MGTVVEWNGVCACGKVAMDGIRCRLGATHKPLYPWNKPPEEKSMLFKYPWELEQ